MKATLEFDLEDPDDAKTFIRTTCADALCSYIYDVEQYVRTKYKYSQDRLISIEQLRQDLHDMKSEAVLLAMEKY